MNSQDLKELTWGDVRSNLQNHHGYIEKRENVWERIIFKTNYQKYKPDTEIMDQIRNILERLPESTGVKILVTGENWCTTCAKIKPKLIKIADIIDSEKLKVYFLEGAKFKFDPKPEEIPWSSKSPPEFLDPKFNIKIIPTTFFFGINGQCLEKVEKHPPNNLTFEELILKILNSL